MCSNFLVGLQLDQGLGIGSKKPFFNRHQLTVTKFINLNKLLNKQKKGAGKPPPAVLNQQEKGGGKPPPAVLSKQEKGAGKPPPAVLALHGRYAGCVGDLPSYDAFALGGPHSVRGYGMGELGASRNLLEASINPLGDLAFLKYDASFFISVHAIVLGVFVLLFFGFVFKIVCPCRLPLRCASPSL